jgi:hypothetical protein
MNHMRTVVICFGISLTVLWPAARSSADGLIYGSHLRPVCGKVCKLVCEKKKLQSVGYGYTCEEICVPAPSRHGCKHCEVTCCLGDEIGGCPPKIEFCWYDWFACGCAKPRTVKVLTKFQAQREVCSYHWEVVDAGCCVTQDGRPLENGIIYKPAPTDAELGDVLAVSQQEWSELAPMLGPAEHSGRQIAEQTAQPTPPSAVEPARPSVAGRVQGLLRR